MKRLAVTTSVLAALVAAPALAGGFETPIAEPIIAPAAPLAFGPSFAGAYAGGSLGVGSLDVDDQFNVIGEGDDDDLFDFDETDTDFAYGLHAGYNFQNGNVVYGAELAVFGSESEVGGDLFDADDEAEDEGSVGVDLNYGARLVARGGYAFGPNLVYGVAGLAYAEVDSRVGAIEDDDSDTGYAVGFGYERLIGERIVVGAQYTLHAFDDFGDDDGDDGAETDLDYRTLEARVSFKF